MPNLSWLALSLLSAFFAALVAIFGKLGIEKTDTTLATMVRAGFMLLALFLVSSATGKLSGLAAIGRKEMLFIALAGLAGALSWICYFAALRLGKATNVAVVDRLSVVFVLVFAAAFLGEKMAWKSILGVLLMLGGAILVALA
jgi:transporter family protein